MERGRALRPVHSESDETLALEAKRKSATEAREISSLLLLLP